jgi:hypothetical protein
MALIALALVMTGGLADRSAACRARGRHHQGPGRADADRAAELPRRHARGAAVRPRHRDGDRLEPRALRAVPAAAAGLLHREHLRFRPASRASPTGAPSRPGAGQRPAGEAGGRPPQGRVPPVGRVRRTADHRAAIRHLAEQLAAHGPSDLGRHLQDADRRGRLFRHPYRVHRRGRPQGQAHQAAGHDGPGRGQRAHADRRQGTGGDAALQPDLAADHLHVLRRGARGFISIDIETNQREWSASSPPCRSRRAFLPTASG